MRNIYDERILPHVIDFICGLPTFENGRKALVPKAAGRVLEVGIGTGRNLPYYEADSLDCLCGIDPGLHPRATRRAQAAGLDVTPMPLSAEKIPADDDSFDCVLSTFTLCTIPDVNAALKEMHRVLVPGGKLLFLEHGASPEPGVRRWQDRITPYWKPVAGGCHLNRQIPDLVRDAGFELDELDERYHRGPRLLTYLYSGVATAQ
ncbi:MAG: class I SAM-dependent methyltransferase [Nevskiales bacterium]|nr:class I SAM-dependent methyltransferase [Nevskiales bacterium]